MKFVIFASLLAIQCFQVHAGSRLGIHDLLFMGLELRPLEAGTFTCPEPEGFYAIPDYCGPEYYTCVSGSPYVTSCPSGAIFDPIALTCTPIDSASCRPPFDCPSSDGFYAIPGSCSSSFYSCVGGTAYVEKCPGNSIFDPVTLVCTPPESVSCRANTSTSPLPTTTTTTTTTTKPTTTATPFTCPAIDGFYPIPGECTGEYYVCIAGNLYTQKCPGTSIYDPEIGICVPAAVASCAITTTSSTTPSTTTTSTSTTTTTTTTRPPTTTTTKEPTSTTTSSPSSNATSTASASPTTTTTPSTTTSTPSTTTTTPSTTTTTPSTTTSTPSTTTTTTTTMRTTTTLPPVTDYFCPTPFGLYPVPGETCSPYFYHCSNSIAYLKSCPPTTYFNPELEVCDYPENIPGCQ